MSAVLGASPAAALALTLASLIWAPTSEAASGPDHPCRQVPSIDRNDSYRATERIRLFDSGPYCLVTDLTQKKRHYPLYEGGGEHIPSGPESYVLLTNDAITIDLQGHRVSSQRSGPTTAFRGLKYSQQTSRPGLETQDLRGAHIHNGEIEATSAGSVGINLSTGRYGYGHYPTHGNLGRSESPAPAEPLDTRHVIENMTIRAGDTGILLSGRGNVVRNCRIIVDTLSAIVSWGPDVVIENNVIEVGRLPAIDRSRQPPGEVWLFSPIRLVGGHGAIIRNNVVRFQQPPGEASTVAAVGLADSREVAISGNTFSGFSAAVEGDAGSHAVESDNRVLR